MHTNIGLLCVDDYHDEISHALLKQQEDTIVPCKYYPNQTLGKVSAATGQNTIGEWNMDGKSIEFVACFWLILFTGLEWFHGCLIQRSTIDTKEGKRRRPHRQNQSSSLVKSVPTSLHRIGLGCCLLDSWLCLSVGFECRVIMALRCKERRESWFCHGKY
jgi:hypothetical protein